MKKARILSMLISLVMVVSILPGTLNVVKAAEEEQFAYIAPDSAYVTFYGDLVSRDASFIDGVSLGITDTNDPNYNEHVILDGLAARKQYRPNTTYITINKPFYEEGDNEFMFTLVYYSFGPDEGPLKIEYVKENGEIFLVDLIKPAGAAHWAAKTVFAYDVKVGGYENGATFRIVNGAYNAFRKVEIANLSKHRREGTVPQLRSLHVERIRELKRYKIVTDADSIFTSANFYKPATKYDILTWAVKYGLKNTVPPQETKNQTMTQGELLKLFFDMAETRYDGVENIVDFALSIGLINDQSYFMNDGAVATYYNLCSLLYSILDFDISPNNPYILKMYNSGCFGDRQVGEIGHDYLSAVYYVNENYLPYEVITDNLTGRTFKYINFFGAMMYRPYLTEQQWLPDGKSFLCGTEKGYIYVYNTETQMLRYIAKGEASTNALDGVVGRDGYIYYIGTMGKYKTLNKIDPKDPEYKSKVVYTFPEGITLANYTVSNDGKWMTGNFGDKYNVLGNPNPAKNYSDGLYTVVTFFIEEGNVPGVPDHNYWVNYYRFPEPIKGGIGHFQPNPVYPELIFFCHEANTTGGYAYTQIFDRLNIFNLKTGENIHFITGQKGDKTINGATHENWSANGEYMYFVSSGETGNGIMRLNKDGSHRQQFEYTNYPKASFININHCFPKDDDVWAASDGNWISLFNLKTHQLFNITRCQDLRSHPYHAHAQVSYGEGNNMLSWGYVRKGVLGVAWYDFTEIVKNEVAKGGRYKVNEYVERVSFETLECESEAVNYKGVNALSAKGGKEIFLSVNPEIADTTNDRVRVTFDYFDNGKESIIFNYTLGVTHENELHLRYNGTESIRRRGTNKWKTMTLEIDGNMESVGKFESDIKFVSGASRIYIANIKVEKVEK